MTAPAVALPVPTKAVGNPLFRYIIATLMVLFAMVMALILAWFKQPITTVDGVIILTALVLGFAAISESTVTFIVTKAEPLLPWGNRRKGDTT